MNVSPKATISNDFRRKYHNFALCILNYAFDCLACVSKLNNHLQSLSFLAENFIHNNDTDCNLIFPMLKCSIGEYEYNWEVLI